MIDSDLVEVKGSLDKIKKISKTIYILLMVAFALCLVFCLIVVFSFIASLFGHATLITSSQSPLEYVSLIIAIVIFASMLAVASRMFSDVANGDSPFTLIRVKRLRIIAWFLLAYAFLQAILSPGFATVLQLGGLDVGYRVVDSAHEASITINFGALVSSIGLFAFALIFKYGVLLQEFSDETL